MFRIKNKYATRDTEIGAQPLGGVNLKDDECDGKYEMILLVKAEDSYRVFLLKSEEDIARNVNEDDGTSARSMIE